MPSPIKNLIFDLGQVIIPLDINQMLEHFSRLGATEVNNKFEQIEVKELWKSFDNNLDSASFRLGMKAALGLPPTTLDSDFDAAWNAMFGQPPLDRFSALKSFRACGFRVFLLSNTNHIHQPFITEHYGEEFKLCFDKQYFSNQTTYAKPEAASYQQILTENGLLPEETLFFDDKLENVQGARALGLHARQFTVEEPMTEVLAEIAKINRLMSSQLSSAHSWRFFAGAASLVLFSLAALWLKNGGSQAKDDRSSLEEKNASKLF